MLVIRPARTSDVKAIRELVDSYAAPGQMLAKETVTLFESVQELQSLNLMERSSVAERSTFSGKISLKFEQLLLKKVCTSKESGTRFCNASSNVLAKSASHEFSA